MVIWCPWIDLGTGIYWDPEKPSKSFRGHWAPVFQGRKNKKRVLPWDVGHVFNWSLKDPANILSKDVRTHIWCPKASSQFCNSLCLYLLTRSGSTVSSVPSKSTICLRSQFGLTFWCEQYSVNLSPRRLIRNDYQWFTLRFTQTWAHMNWVPLIFPHQWPKFRGSRMYGMECYGSSFDWNMSPNGKILSSPRSSKMVHICQISDSSGNPCIKSIFSWSTIINQNLIHNDTYPLVIKRPWPDDRL